MLNGFKKARLIAGLTQSELADRVGVSHVAVCKWETGKGMPNTKRLIAVAEALNTTVVELLKEEGAN